MSTIVMIACALLGALLLLLAFLLLGALRTIAILTWRLDQLEATTPGRLNRDGLARGAFAPAFTLPDLGGGRLTFEPPGNHSRLLVFVQSGCGPCHDIIPELNHLQRRRRDLQVFAVLHADSDEAREWRVKAGPTFPVAVQEDWSVSKQYEVFATPFAFLIDERGVILSKGILMSRQHIGLLLSTANRRSSDAMTVNEHVSAGTPAPALQTP